MIVFLSLVYFNVVLTNGKISFFLEAERALLSCKLEFEYPKRSRTKMLKNITP